MLQIFLLSSEATTHPLLHAVHDGVKLEAESPTESRAVLWWMRAEMGYYNNMLRASKNSMAT